MPVWMMCGKKYIQERIKENENNIKTCKTPFGAFTLGRFVPFLAIKDYKKKIKEDTVLLQKLEEEKTQEPQVQYISFETFLRSQYSKKDLIAEYETLYGEDLAKTQTAVAVVEKYGFAVNDLYAISRQLPDVAYLPQIATIVHGELKERYPSEKMILFQQNIEEYATLAVDLLLSVLRGTSPAEQRLSYRFIPVS